MLRYPFVLRNSLLFHKWQWYLYHVKWNLHLARERKERPISCWLDGVDIGDMRDLVAKTNAAKRRQHVTVSAIERFSPLSRRRRLAASRRRRDDGWASVITSHAATAAATTGRLIGLWIQQVRTDVRRLQVISTQALPAASSLTVDHRQPDRGKRSFQRNLRKIATDRILRTITTISHLISMSLSFRNRELSLTQDW